MFNRSLKSEFIQISALHSIVKLYHLPSGLKDGRVSECLPELNIKGAIHIFQLSQALHYEPRASSSCAPGFLFCAAANVPFHWSAFTRPWQSPHPEPESIRPHGPLSS